MGITRLSLALALASALGLSAQTAISEELTIATFVPPQHHTNTVMFKWFGEEVRKTVWRNADHGTLPRRPARRRSGAAV